MSMNWSRLVGASCGNNMPAPLLAEGRRLNEMIAAVMELRASADAAGDQTAQARKTDPTADRSPYYVAILAALRAELEVYEPLNIFLDASAQWNHRAKKEAEQAVLDVRDAIRKRLGIPDYIEVPICCLQNDPAWWAARKTVDLFPVFENGYNPESEALQDAPRRIGGEIRSYEHALTAEGRLTRRESEAAAERDCVAAEREQTAAENRDEYLMRQQRIDSLLTEPERSKGQRRAPTSKGGAE